ncbi:MAG: amidase [Acidimicrobiia bacterium]|nr:amidase [Acidimicrobiia bacterium]MYB23540.1 amidase [Acidimicrobiia bacterium]MYJ13828.1 amidase [Acidimicrobiia bacterium]
MDVSGLSIARLGELYAAGEAEPSEVLAATLERIERLDGALGAFSEVTAERAVAEATERTEELRRGESRGPLHGVPVAIKELFDVAGAVGDYGSDVLAGRVPDADAESVRRLREAGAVIVGVTRSHEFGWGITSQHATRPSPRNPWNLERVPGGSSGGSAAAVAAGMVPAAVASDTGGSVRIPATYCGTAGIKPTLGRISRAGGAALAPTLDTPGAVAARVADLWPLLAAMSGPHAGDPATLADPLPPAPDPDAFGDGLAGVRVGISEALAGPVSWGEGTTAGFDRTCEALWAAGAVIVEVDLPAAEDMLAAFIPLQMAEAYDLHNRRLGLYPGRAEDYGGDVRSRLELAAVVTMGEYLEARRRRLEFIWAFDRAFESLDVLLTPISAVGPSRIDEPDTVLVEGERRALREVVMGFTVPQNLTGLPTVALPVGFDADGLPVGMQFTAGRGREDTAVRVAGAVERMLASEAPRLPVTPGQGG